ncbi:hypothetical protein FQR65_LT18222 [Abscondita terminalis]|nr:hypothetical protein FQR65_LT18222 [Abscondita terminalis]
MQNKALQTIEALTKEITTLRDSIERSTSKKIKDCTETLLSLTSILHTRTTHDLFTMNNGQITIPSTDVGVQFNKLMTNRDKGTMTDTSDDIPEEVSALFCLKISSYLFNHERLPVVVNMADLIFLDAIREQIQRLHLNRMRRHLRDLSDPLNIPDLTFKQLYRINKNTGHWILTQLGPHMRNPQIETTYIPKTLRKMAMMPMTKMLMVMIMIIRTSWWLEEMLETGLSRITFEFFHGMTLLNFLSLYEL